MGYLLCKSCGGRYDLKPGELPGEFESCGCGGKLEFYDDRGHKRGYKPINHENKSKKNSPLMKLLIILGVGFVVIQIYGSITLGIMAGINGKIDFGNQFIFYVIEIILGLMIALVCFLLIKK